MPSWMLTSGSRIVGGEDAPSPIPWQVSVFTGLAILNSKYLEIEIKTFGLGSTIGDVFSELCYNLIVLGVTSGNGGRQKHITNLNIGWPPLKSI